MTEISIFGNTVPAVVSTETDGVAGYWTEQQFYTTSEFPTGHTITKGKAYIPVGSGHIGKPYSMALARRDAGTGVITADPTQLDADLDTNGSKSTGVLAAGWNILPFTGGPYVVHPGDGFIVGLLIDSGAGYLFNDTLNPAAIPSADSAAFVLAEDTIRCAYHGSWTTANWYGIDVVLDDGTNPPDPVEVSNMSLSDLEVAYLRKESGITDPISLSDLRAAVYGPSQHAYFAALSGLSSGSLADHKLAYYRDQTGLSEGSLVDCARAFWTAELEA